MALLGFWGLGYGRLPEIAVASGSYTVEDNQFSGLPAWAPWAIFPAINQTVYFDFPERTADTESIIVGFWGRFPFSSATTRYPWQLQQGGVSEYIRFDVVSTTNTVNVTLASSRTGAVTATLGTFTVTDVLTWNFYEIEWFPHNTTGILRVRANGAVPTGWTDIDSGDTTINQSTNLGFNLWTNNISGYFPTTSGMYALDSSGSSLNSLLGICHFPYLNVDGDVENDFVGSDGNSVDNYLLIDESPAAVATLSDYVESTTPTDRQVCSAQNLFTATGLNGGAIAAVKASMWCQDPNTVGATADIGVVSNSVDQFTNVNLPQGPSAGGVRSHTSLVDPNTGAAWTEAGLDAADALIKVP